MLSQNKVHLATPVFEPTNRRYSEFPFLKLVDYPGTDSISTEDETMGLNVVLQAVLKSWPLLAVTLILTAIAGVIVRALVSFVYVCFDVCNCYMGPSHKDWVLPNWLIGELAKNRF